LCSFIWSEMSRFTTDFEGVLRFAKPLIFSFFFIFFRLFLVTFGYFCFKNGQK